MLYQTNHSPLHVNRLNSFDYVPHAHHAIELLICTKGNFKICCNFRTEVLNEGDAMIAFSNDIHSYKKCENGEGIIIIVDPSLLRYVITEDNNRRYENFLLSSNLKLKPVADALYEEYKSAGSMSIMVGYLYVIFGMILKVLNFTNQTLSLNEKSFSQILKYVSESYTQKLSLRALSKRFGLTESHVSRCFTQKLSCSFTRHLHSLRVEHAKNLLTQSTLSILEIVFESGFSDQRTFNRVFKDLTGVTPKEYRRQNS